MKYAIIDNNKIEIAPSEEGYFLNKYPELKIIEPELEPNWNQLVADLRGTAVFGKAFTTAAPNPWSLLLTSLTTTHLVEDLSFALYAVRASMPIDFTESEIAEINQKLAANNFEFQL